MSLGLGPSSARITCAPLCSEKPGAGASGTLGLGGTIGGRLRLGFEAVTWSPTEDHRTFWEDYDKYVAALLTARYFVTRTGNTYVNVGFGGGGLHLVNDELDSKDLVAQVGLGHDFRLSRKFALGPYANFLTSFNEDVVIGSSHVDGKTHMRLLQLGAAITYHQGTPKPATGLSR